MLAWQGWALLGQAASNCWPFTWYVLLVGSGRVEAPRRGRRSLSGSGDSPQLRVRLPEDVRDALARRAAHEGVTISELARGVLTSAADERAPARLSGPLGRRLRQRRREVLAAAAAHGITNVRVFGSVARGDDRPDSDIDLLADLPDGLGLVGLGQARSDLERILDARVDLVPATDLKPDVAARAIADLVPL